MITIARPLNAPIQLISNAAVFILNPPNRDVNCFTMKGDLMYLEFLLNLFMYIE